MTDPSAFGGRVAEIWAKFRPSTLDRVAVLEQIVLVLRAGDLDPESRRNAEREAHKLAGSLGTFGFPEGSRIARTIEEILGGDAAIDIERLASLVTNLRRGLE
jgi:HPt (histidine-containing phosphotransfer) domain-containing protein